MPEAEDIAKEKAKNEQNMVMAAPAVYANRFLVNTSAQAARIAFVDSDGTNSYCRGAIAMSRDDALELARMIVLLFSQGEVH